MATDFAAIPAAGAFRLSNATLPATLLAGVAAPAGADLVRADIAVRDGRIEAIEAPRPDVPGVDLDGGMVFPAFTDMHTHLDKGHIWPRQGNPDGTFLTAREAVRADREAKWSAADVAARMDFALRCAWAHGTALLRTHIDSLPPQHRISWPVFSDIRERWAGRIDLQGVSLVPIDFVPTPEFDEIVATVREHRGVLGAATHMAPGVDRAIERLLTAAAEAGLDLDLHVDETADPAARSLRLIADAAIRLRFPGRITVGHCCSLARQPASEADETMDRVAEAGLSVVSLPLCNLYLQDRHAGATPRWRGVTLLREMAARGITVAVASDNTRDPFHAYGDLDMLEVFREAVRVLHLDTPFGDWPRVGTATPAEILGHAGRGRIAAGGPADLVLFRARGWTELLSRPQADRVVLRGGRAIDRALPDYRELDGVVGAEGAPALEAPLAV